MLRTRAGVLRREQDRARAEADLARRKQAEKQAEQQRRLVLQALEARGDSVWHEIEAEIERGNASGYAKAVELLSGLKAVAARRGSSADFNGRLSDMRQRHARKGSLIRRLASAGV